MTDRFYVIAIGIEYESTIIILMIVRPKPRWAIVATPRGKGGLIELSDDSAAFCENSYMHALSAFRYRSQPEIRFLVLAKTEIGPAAALLSRNVIDQHHPERGERPFIETPRCLQIRHRKSYMIEHRWSLCLTATTHTCRATIIFLISA